MKKLLCRFSAHNNRHIKRISDRFAIYSSNDFDNMPPEVAKANVSGSAAVKVVGDNLPRLADWSICFEGDWKYSKKYGYTFYADRYELISPSTKKGIERYLSSKAFPGIGEKTAKAIVEEFKEETLDVIEKTPNLLLRIPGINIDKVGTIAEYYRKNVAYSRLCAFLASYSVSERLAAGVYETLEDKTIEDIRKNPYMLQEVKGIGFQTCEKIARTEGVQLDSFDRMDGATKQILLENSEGGDMFMGIEDFEKKSLNLLNNGLNPEPVSQSRFHDYVRHAVKKGKIVIRGKKIVFLKEYDDAEDHIAKKIALMLSDENGLGLSVSKVSGFVDDYCSSSSVRFTDNQKNAVIRSLITRLSIITGGPGTGKTTILKALIEVFRRLHPSDEVILMAPTGKAARRMNQATGYPSSTIHSKLQIYDETKVSSSVLEQGLVVVDEASMIDSLLMEKLLMSVSSKMNQIVFIGDINQLPSVGPGAVLKDMIGSGSIPVSRLTEIFRQKEGASIVENANKVNEGKADLTYDESFELVTVKNEEDAVEKIKGIYAAETSRWGIDNVALLSPLRRTQNRFTCVSDGLNSVLQNEIVPTGGTAVVFNGIEYRIGDRVMQWKNTEKSSNGDIGAIEDIIQTDDGLFVKVKWENGNETEETRESMNDIKLAYSISIHKSQGSEYDCCIIPLLSDQICRLFQKNLIYTGITRSKRKCILVTDGDRALDYCVSNNRENRRNTLLMQRIVASMKTA